MSRYVVSPLSRTDLDGIWDYIAADNIAAADRTLERFHELIHMLARQPLIGESRDDLLPHLRSFPAGNYVIYYFPIPNGVRIVRVIHAARDIADLF